MGLRESVDGFYIGMLRDDLRLTRDGRLDIGFQTLLYLELIRYTDRCTVGKLAGMLNLDKSTVSRKIDSMVTSGMVVKERDPEDGRVTLLRMSPEYDALYDGLDGSYADALKEVETGFDMSEIETACRVLDALTRRLFGDNDG